jgi:UDP-glucose 4-epimerase
MHILICGGAGYIGSHMARWLARADMRATVLDNLSTGHRASVQWGELLEADLLDPESLERAFAGRRFDAVMHFCARSLVGESMTDPYGYYASNVGGTLNLLQAMRRHGVDRLVFFLDRRRVRPAPGRAHRRRPSEASDQSLWR